MASFDTITLLAGLDEMTIQTQTNPAFLPFGQYFKTNFGKKFDPILLFEKNSRFACDKDVGKLCLEAEENKLNFYELFPF